MSNRGAVVLVVFALLVLGGAGAWFAGMYVAEHLGLGPFVGESEDPALDDHLEREAERLASDADEIEQPDAKWIAQQLGDDPTVERLRELINERFEEMSGEYAKRLKHDFPEFYDYPAYLRKGIEGDNGVGEIEAASELAEALEDTPRFEDLLYAFNADLSAFDEQTKSSYLDESKGVFDAIVRANDADVIAYLPKRPETWLEMTHDIPQWTAMSRAAIVRIRILAGDDGLEQARRELTTLVSVIAKTRMDVNLIGVLVSQVAREMVLEYAVLELAVIEEVPVQDLKNWLELGRTNHPDVMFAFACEFADYVRVLEGGDEPFDPVRLLEGADGFETVEEFFREWRRDAEGRFAVMEYALNPHPPIYTPEGLADAAELDRQVAPLLLASDDDVPDAARTYWRWLALELRIFERENGPLHEHREEVEALVTVHPWLKPEWDGDVLEVWTLNASGDEYIEDDPLFKLAPVQKQ